MITLVGVGHVFAISDRLKQIIHEKRPDVVCLELDMGRYRSLLDRSTSRSVPVQYRLLAYFQKKMARSYGTEVGQEMIAAAEAASELGAKIALIDMDASVVFSELWKHMSFREKLRLLTGSVLGLFASRKAVEKEIERYENQEQDYIDSLGEEFPTVKKVLLDDRNKHMASKIEAISSEHPNVLAVIGDGHVQGVMENLKSQDVEAYRLKDLRAPAGEIQSGAEYTASYWYHSREES